MKDTVLKSLVNIVKLNTETNMRAWRVTILRINFHSSCHTLNRENADVDNFFSNKISVKLDRHGRLQFMDFKITFDQLHDEQREALILVGVAGVSYEDAGQIDPDTELGLRLRDGTDGQCHDGRYRNPQFANMTAAKWFYTLWVFISLVLTLALLTVCGLALYQTSRADSQDLRISAHSLQASTEQAAKQEICSFSAQSELPPSSGQSWAMLS
jgi:RNA polymerase sigma-70 factor (ECF subfamily)